MMHQYYSYSLLIATLILSCTLTTAWQQQQSPTNRRGALEGIAGLAFLPPAIVHAQPAELQNLGTQAPLPGAEDTPFVTLPNGVKTKDFSVGTGGETVSGNSRVSIQCSGRLLNLNGVVFYNTKNNNPDGFGAVPLTVTLGQNQALPGLEAGLVGMRKNGIRRIIVPAELAYSKYPDLEPQPMTELDRRALDSVIKNPRRDATILFDVRLERFK
ncbi:cis-trans isomerase [Seminavis robusta]|uniref:peptidylprolyl isomerase n=1 Tax=Seminavis robusta TaxID=568900 RepID=A0A9N8DXL1_9STRA|nr:cis-trans isomerase [Seminavis robusta]|eukprot:Sro425_g140080.1 cis-trans isomerase (214) ;mRNA; r:16368-17009